MCVHVCVCACMCVRVRACVCVCEFLTLSHTLSLSLSLSLSVSVSASVSVSVCLSVCLSLSLVHLFPFVDLTVPQLWVHNERNHPQALHLLQRRLCFHGDGESQQPGCRGKRRDQGHPALWYVADLPLEQKGVRQGCEKGKEGTSGGCETRQ